ncbi:MAG: hypothetical protein NTX50_27655 [Candidatus Sumerlaeota bacterium]|nr:hypothetical protein [Candidatus Sumerlaeota bacterium]
MFEFFRVHENFSSPILSDSVCGLCVSAENLTEGALRRQGHYWGNPGTIKAAHWRWVAYGVKLDFDRIEPACGCRRKAQEKFGCDGISNAQLLHSAGASSRAFFSHRLFVAESKNIRKRDNPRGHSLIILRSRKRPHEINAGLFLAAMVVNLLRQMRKIPGKEDY